MEHLTNHTAVRKALKDLNRKVGHDFLPALDDYLARYLKRLGMSTPYGTIMRRKHITRT